MPERYSTATLLSMIEEVEAPSSFFTNTFFGTEVYFDTQTVEFDIVRKGYAMAPFVAPTVRGKPIQRDGFITKQFKPAYIKQSSTVDLTRPLSRMPGEPWGGNMTPMQRLNRLMAEDIASHSVRIQQRIEWMAANTILNGGYEVSGEEYPTVYVDFGRDANLDVVLAGAATWDQTTSSPLRDLEQMALEVRNKSYGAVCNTVVMDGLSWGVFSAHADVKELLDLEVGRRTDLNSTSFDMGIRNDRFGGGTGAELRGRVAGKFDIWVYEGYFMDDAGAMVPIMPDYTVIVASPRQIEGAQLYGAILDQDAQYQSVKMFAKSRSQWDPSGEELLTQSAPLVMPKRINTWGKLTVA